MNAARGVSVLSVAWSAAVGCTATGLGVAQGSTVLVAFGAVSFVDGVGSAVLAYHFHHGLRHDGLTERLERLARLIVISGLVCVGVATIALGAARLFDPPGTRSSELAVALAALSLIVLVCLMRAKRRLAIRVRSAALHSDSHLSAVGAAQSAVALGGVLAADVGWGWADPAAAMAVGVVAVAVGIRTARGEH